MLHVVQRSYAAFGSSCAPAFTDMIGTAAVRIRRSRNTCYVAWVRSLMGRLHPDGLKVSRSCYIFWFTCLDVPSFVSTLSRWCIFRQVMVCSLLTRFVFVSWVLSRCPIFRQHPAKMAHLSAGHGLFINCWPVLFLYHKCCQDVTSFVSTLPRWHIFQQVMFHLCFAVAIGPVGSLWSPWRRQDANSYSDLTLTWLSTSFLPDR